MRGRRQCHALGCRRPDWIKANPVKSAAEATFALLAVVALTLAFVTMTVACLNILSTWG